MALSVRQEGVKQVPWFSLAEWHQVYEQIYSNDANEQMKGYRMMLAWKARIPKLPVGVDCTLAIMQVCIRDREWAPKINKGELPISYENDLCLMYSTTIMRFLNHITNIGHTKQSSLFQIAKQINIPEWIVNLRHDTAHGYELPSISVLRIAVNILLAWLHEEYWAAEAKQIEEYLIAEESMRDAQAMEDVQDFDDLIELWTSVSLYIHAGHQQVSSVPDSQLKETLQDLRSYANSLLENNNEDVESNKNDYTEAASDDIKGDKKYTLETAKTVLLSEISRYLSRRTIPNKNEIVCNTLCSSEAFLPNKDILSIFTQNEDTEKLLEKDVLPLEMTNFWKDIIFVLHEKDLMEALIVKLFQLINNEEVNAEKKLVASLWISSISYCFVKLDAAHSVARSLEYQLQTARKSLSSEAFELKVKEETERTYPHLKRVLWFNLTDVVLPCLTDIKFVSKLLLNVNELSVKFMVPILELVSPKMDKESNQLLLSLMSIYTTGETTDDKNTHEHEKTFTLEDIRPSESVQNTDAEQNKPEDRIPRFLADQKVRNEYWKFSTATCNWMECPIGLLPWQSDTLEFIKPLDTIVENYGNVASECEITPGIIDRSKLKMRSRINWDNVLRKKRRLSKRQERRNAAIIMNKALETARKQK